MTFSSFDRKYKIVTFHFSHVQINKLLEDVLEYISKYHPKPLLFANKHTQHTAAIYSLISVLHLQVS